MPRRIALGCIGSIVCYFIAAFGGGFLISVLSSNTHDKHVEAAMTGAFVIGPMAALLGGILVVVLPPRKTHPPDDAS
jgi:hypothetical protein